MADTARAITLRPGRNGWFGEKGSFECWVRLVHDCESKPNYGHTSPKPSKWNIPGGEHRHPEWPLHVTAEREGLEEGIPKTFSIALEEEIPFEKHLSGRSDDRRTEMGFWANRTSSHRIAAFLLVEELPTAINRDPKEPEIKDFKFTNTDGTLEYDMVGWFHIDHLPEDMYYSARIVLIASLRALREERRFTKFFQL